jgi:hypothetical protein
MMTAAGEVHSQIDARSALLWRRDWVLMSAATALGQESTGSGDYRIYGDETQSGPRGPPSNNEFEPGACCKNQGYSNI